jgi:hypothetical protein
VRTRSIRTNVYTWFARSASPSIVDRRAKPTRKIVVRSVAHEGTEYPRATANTAICNVRFKGKGSSGFRRLGDACVLCALAGA